MNFISQLSRIPIILCFILFFFHSVSAQIPTDLKVQVQPDNLLGIFGQIESHTDFSFAYNSSEINLERRFSPTKKALLLQALLNEISKAFSIEFNAIGQVIYVKKVVTPKMETVGGREEKSKKNILLSGTVFDATVGEPLIGATVYLKNDAGIGTITDFNGRYELSVPEGSEVLVFSYIGFENKEVRIGDQTIINVTLGEAASVLDEVVVVGYGVQKKQNITGAIAKISDENIESQIVTSLDDAIAGQLAGVDINQSSGAPGTTAQINIRGIGTLTAGSNPLIVIDGFPSSESTDLSAINPSEIESIEILKDASSAAIYGSRGSNGVILVTTKKGKKDKTAFSFHSFYGVQQVAKKIDLMDAYQRANFIATARNNSWTDQSPGNSASDPNSRRPGDLQIPTFLFPYLEGQQGLTNTDWQDEIFRDAPFQNYELTASGGNGGINFFVSGNYHNREGIVINSGFERYSLRANVGAQLTDRLKMGLNLAPSFTKADEVSEEDHKGNGVIFTALLAHPAFAARDENGEPIVSEMINSGRQYGFAQTENPVALAELTEAQKKVFQMLGNIFLEFEPIENLTLKTQFGGQFITAREDIFRPSTLGAYTISAPTQAAGSSETDDILNYSLENTLTYQLPFAERHNMELLLGQSFQHETVEGNFIQATNFPNDNVTTLNAGQVTFGSSYRERWNLLSYFGRINYDFAGRYLLSVAIRRDGSSRFGRNNKWGLFPSMSLGWNLAKENFFQLAGVNTLKVRGSYGLTGNNQIPNFGSVALLNDANYIIDGAFTNGQTVATAPNDNLSWERTKMLNVGLDGELWDGKLFFSADYYISNTEDLLLNVPVPAHTGFSTSLQNIGSVENRGLEFSVGGHIPLGPVTWRPRLNFSTNQNKVTALGPDQNRILDAVHITEIGLPIGSYYGYQVLGVFQDEAELATYPHLSSAKVGSYKYEDVNNDGSITDADRTVLGDFFPDYSFGLSSQFQYKNFDLSVLVSGKQGHDIFYGMGFFHFNEEGWNTASVELIDNYFEKENPKNSIYARPLASPTDKNYEFSNLMVRDGSYIRIRNISLGYNLPKNWLQKAKLQNARIYLTAQNPFTFTKYIGYNPEVSSRNKSWNRSALTPGVDYGAYPVAKSYVGGIQIQF